MTTSEAAWLLTGMELGVVLCVVASAITTVRLNRRTVACAAATVARGAKYKATDGWRSVLVIRETT
ncbi:hypothetical protein [Streptomyces erythrochromogenes]|uniref:hypothetical protein n=1 Tax=Streptomyces erythrochromogenes TaxID=285574 RepID=UPI0033EF36BF